MVSPISKLRHIKGYTRKDLAEIAGVSVNTIFRLEHPGRTTPSERTLRRVAAALGVPVSEVVAAAAPPSEPTPRRLKRVRADYFGLAGWYLAQLAGISERTLWRAERGEPVSRQTIEKIANVLEVHPLELAPDLYGGFASHPCCREPRSGFTILPPPEVAA